MKRMKSYWDEIHPELSFFTDKNLREQATRVGKRKVVMATEYNQRENVKKQGIPPETVLENSAGNNLSEEVGNDEMINMNLGNISPEIDTRAGDNNGNLDEANRTSDEYKTMRNSFNDNYETLKEKSIEERVITTNTVKKIDKALLAMINDILNEHLKMKVEVNYWEIDVSLYTAAYTIKQYVGELPQKLRQK